MIEIRRTRYFAKWLSRLRDHRARGRIEARIDRLQRGNPGDVKLAGSGISELRIDYGPGFCSAGQHADCTVSRWRQKHTSARHSNCARFSTATLREEIMALETIP